MTTKQYWHKYNIKQHFKRIQWFYLLHVKYLIQNLSKNWLRESVIYFVKIKKRVVMSSISLEWEENKIIFNNYFP